MGDAKGELYTRRTLKLYLNAFVPCYTLSYNRQK